jgi:hypothetical protein
MRLLSRLEHALGRLAVPYLSQALVVCQIVVYVVAMGVNAQNQARGILDRVEDKLVLIPDKVLEGEVWRLVSFLLWPPVENVFLALLAWYCFWWTGSALERVWGTFRYNLYLLIGWVATVAASFLTLDSPASNGFLFVGVLLAFAWMVPEFRVLIYFVLPIPVKWIAWVTWAGIAAAVVLGSWAIKAQAVAAVANFLLFFGRDLIKAAQTARRRMARQQAAYVAEVKRAEFFHQCRVCGITDRTHPKMDFRYCSKCAGQCCYCTDHLRAHEHKTAG